MENKKLHLYQLQLLKKLVTSHGLKFNDLLIEGLESEHVNYHLKKLIEIGFIEKDERLYKLTHAGKDYSNMLDDKIEIVERQPKTSIIIWAVRKNKETGKVEHLVNRRLRHPYYGKVGRITGKVQFGERLEEAARRELYEETGLVAESFVLESIYHKIRKNSEDIVVQDVIFYLFLVTELSGSLIEKTPFQENFWITKEDVKIRTDLDLHDDFDIDDRLEAKALSFIENIGISQGY
jgi:ADP-ribose pyrophosphatase YjhB (NUDIX family)